MDRICTMLLLGVLVANAGADQPQCPDDGRGSFGMSDDLGTINVDGGQVNGAGATLFVDFFTFQQNTNDWIDVDNDGIAGRIPFFPFTDQLASQISFPETHTWWMFNYRSVGSVNGFNEFVDWETCAAQNFEIPSERGIFNRLEYAINGFTLLSGANRTGTPVEQCSIQFAFLDVPGGFAVQVEGEPKWDRKPGQPGYGLNPIPSDTGFISNLETLTRTCGSCVDSGDPCVRNENCVGFFTRECTSNGTGLSSGEDCTNDASVCDPDESCAPTDSCDLTGGSTVSLNADIAEPDGDTLFSEVAAWVPVVPIANRGTGLENVTYSQMQHHFVTGRFPNGMNLAAATRDVGSGTRNAWTNSLGIDTSWGRGDNVGDKNAEDVQLAQLGPDHQPTNCGGSGIEEEVVQARRLAFGYTGMAGGSRAVRDAKQGKYEILNVRKDIDGDGDGEPDCTSGWVRPTIDTVLDNCDPCTGYQIGGLGSFVVRGDWRDNAGGGPTPVPNEAVADYLENLFTSIEDFSGSPLDDICNVSRECSTRVCNTSGLACGADDDCTSVIAWDACGPLQTCIDDSHCPGVATCTGQPQTCADDADCFAFATYKVCTSNGAPCDDDLDCPSGETCYEDNYCKGADNSPGEGLARAFFLPAGVDCVQSQLDPVQLFGTCSSNGAPCTTSDDCPAAETCDTPINPVLQQFIRDNNDLDAGGDTPAFGSVNAAGLVPIRVNLSSGRYSDGGSTQNQYCGGLTESAALPASYVPHGDADGDGVRDLGDAAGLVEAYYTPRAWQTGDGRAPELLFDFNGDGSLTKEDLRYWMDGLAIVGGQLDRKQGAQAIDTAIAGEGKPFPWADTRKQLLIPPASFCGAEPTFEPPAAINGIFTTGKSYAAGDFRGDVAGNAPLPGADPRGWDGDIDNQDIDYVCANIGEWSNLDEAAYMDLSCDMNGDAAVSYADVTELVTVILGTQIGDADLDGDVDADDAQTVLHTINTNGGCNAADPPDCGWADGDFTCDGIVDKDDLAFTPAGDFDGDGDVDLADYEVFEDCLEGPDVPPAPTPPTTSQDCLDAFDLNVDGDVDTEDFCSFQVTFTG